MSEATVEELVEAVKAPGTFSILSVLKDRLYPSDTVSVRVDEDAPYRAAAIQEKIVELEKADADSGFNLPAKAQKELDALIASRDLIVKSIEADSYIFSIVGISEGKREELLLQATALFPAEFNEDKNPYTGEVTRTEKESKDRDRIFTNLLWENHIVKIVAPDGAVQDTITHADIIELRTALPLASISAITGAIEKIRVATAMFMFSVDEDFLAKS